MAPPPDLQSAALGLCDTAPVATHTVGLPEILVRYEPVIGIEVHCQLKTASKMFCGCSTADDGAPPNTHVCPVCLGLPGALPTINRAAVEHVLATGIAIEAASPEKTRWERKNYFYPDLPKGYQISQYEIPLTANGRLTFDTSEGPVTIGITRAHLEEDTAKLIHATGPDGRWSLATPSASLSGNCARCRAQRPSTGSSDFMTSTRPPPKTCFATSTTRSPSAPSRTIEPSSSSGASTISG